MNICLINQTERSHIIMQLKLLVMALSAPVALNALATTEPFAFTPEKVSTELSLGRLSGKTKERVGNDSNLLIVFYVQIMPDDFVMQLHRF